MSIAWLAPEPSYRSYLQVRSLISMLIIAAILITSYFTGVYPKNVVPLWIAGLAWTLLTLFFSLFFASRRFLFTAYARTNEGVHLKQGALFRRIRAVPLNRIQHVEYKQSFLERLFGIARLAMYTAGSGGADLTIPGLLPDTAMQLKTELLTTIANEPDKGESNHE
ncbi:PH domain-containing protein [Pseudidiomarina terrestris]|uniref:PH domain-containing protein n=1 Tax=Pseudidiomarina terrestris TaxID=2820060 RepID=UPI002656498D|nr:PH domain-containing protein [Pseudidiomarina sp. 1ASP75-5]MDN7135580.1 PH domain-containing protein [Pseudidiomarina sp. 1ASP75-5]